MSSEAKKHRWVVVVTLAATDEEAEASKADVDLLLGSRRGKSVSPIICFDCRTPVRKAEPVCPGPHRDGYPGT